MQIAISFKVVLLEPDPYINKCIQIQKSQKYKDATRKLKVPSHEFGAARAWSL